MQYSNLDDLPYSIRQRLGAPSSPNPSHYSLVPNTPPTGPHNPYNRQKLPHASVTTNRVPKVVQPQGCVLNPRLFFGTVLE